MNNPDDIKILLQTKMDLCRQLYDRNELGEGYTSSLSVTAAIDFYKRYWDVDFSDCYHELIELQPVYQLILAIASKRLSHLKMHDAAAILAETIAYNASGDALPLFYAATLREKGDLQGARNIANGFLAGGDKNTDAVSELAECDVAELFLSSDYYDALHLVHQHLMPETYLEIGVAQGRSMALARKGTTSIGVDPDTGSLERIFFHSPENTPKLFRMTSDDFFASCDLPGLMGKTTVDVAFLDGLHHFDQTLRDFINVERYAGANSLILIHDCLPVNALVAERERQSGFWLGDVWKIIPCLKAIRPDLDIVTLPVKPSGLAIIRNLDSSSRILERQFENITEHFNSLVLPESWEDKCKLCCVTDQSPESLFGNGEGT